MALMKCNTCGGEYRDVLPDGMLYFHTCSPVTLVTVDDHDRMRLQLTPAQLALVRLVPSEAARAAAIADGETPSNIYVEISRRDVKRRDHRDENTQRRDGKHDEIRVLKSEGLGATVVKTDAELTAESADAP